MCAQTLLVFAAVGSNHFVVKNSDFVVDGKEDVEKVTYGMDIPEAYQSEPLKAMMAQKS